MKDLSSLVVIACDLRVLGVGLDHITHMIHGIKRFFHAPPIEHLLLAVLFALPLLYIPGQTEASKTIRWGLLVAIAVTLLYVTSLRAQITENFRLLGATNRIAVIALVFSMLASTMLSIQAWDVRILGWEAEYLGLVTWLSFIIIAIGLRFHVIDFLRSSLCLIVFGVVLATSLLLNVSFLINGFRLEGLLVQATSMGMYAAMCMSVGLWHYVVGVADRTRIVSASVVGLSTTAVLLSQSRAAQVAAIFSCLLLTAYLVYKKLQSWALPVILSSVLVIVPLLFGSYFVRLQGEEVRSGVEYRIDIYSLAAEEVTGHNPLFGLGPSGIPETINSKDQVPQKIAETLDKGYVFLSSHDIFLDIALYFGLVGAVAFSVLVLRSVYVALTVQISKKLILACLGLSTMLINGLLNVPSLELTLLLFVFVFALLNPTQYSSKLQKTNKSL